MTGRTDRPSSAENNVSALFDERSAAQNAIDMLKQAGISPDGIGLIADMTGRSREKTEEKGLLKNLGDFLFPKEDRVAYGEGLRRGGFVVFVSNLSSENHEKAVAVLDKAGAVDLDERISGWKSEGWDDTQDYLDGLQDAPTLIDSGEAAALIASGQKDQLVPVITRSIDVGRSEPGTRRVRVYKVEYARKDDGAGAR